MINKQVFLPIENSLHSSTFIVTMQHSNSILQTLEALRSFQIVQCQMHHEKVATDQRNHPKYNLQDGVIVFNRVNLCDAKLRNKRLGCAHSKANLNFETVLDTLISNLPQCKHQMSTLKSEFKSVVTKIYALDHRVGHIEHERSLCQLNSDSKKEANLTESLGVLKTEHHVLMNQLLKIKTDIEQLIKLELNYSNL
ncbi:hypothetical protein [Psychroserpens sp. SPM9]|uniref:hypothetical protein n=1 Tax=Psychroserpens sp. SPM9 TaxID=2975598 RepID=UPI0021A4BAEA|nr:hypothetical protein [Psychroserpens sp. SPM9]MDG5490029.1 hypothetical protein [Psychroserpens sp. SPM9]